jgi:hypothetical protein
MSGWNNAPSPPIAGGAEHTSGGASVTRGTLYLIMTFHVNVKAGAQQLYIYALGASTSFDELAILSQRILSLPAVL